MKSLYFGNNAISFEFDKNYILSGIHRIKTTCKNNVQVSYMIFGLIITYGRYF